VFIIAYCKASIGLSYISFFFFFFTVRAYNLYTPGKENLSRFRFLCVKIFCTLFLIRKAILKLERLNILVMYVVSLPM